MEVRHGGRDESKRTQSAAQCLRSGERASDQQSHAGWFGDGRRVGWVVCCDDELVLGAVDIVSEVELSKDERWSSIGSCEKLSTVEDQGGGIGLDLKSTAVGAVVEGQR